MGVESYKHLFAKDTLAGWFREISSHDEYVGIAPVRWRVNRPGPNFGIWTEYPICIDSKNEIVGIDPVWDESPRWGYAEDGIAALPRGGERPPSYQEVIGMGLTPVLIFDVAVQHKGNIIYALEVVHRNDISATKLDYIHRARSRSNSLEVYTIDADWILSRTKRPTELACKRII